MKVGYKFLHFISIINSYILAFAILFIIQKYTIGQIGALNRIVIFNKIYLYEILFAATSLFIIIKYVRVYSPYEKHLDKH